MAKEPTLPPSKRRPATKLVGAGVSRKPTTAVKPKPPPAPPPKNPVSNRNARSCGRAASPFDRGYAKAAEGLFGGDGLGGRDVDPPRRADGVAIRFGHMRDTVRSAGRRPDLSVAGNLLAAMAARPAFRMR